MDPRLADLATLAHDGKVVVVGTGSDGVLYYSVRQSGFENSALAGGSSESMPGFEEWKVLALNKASDDESVVAFNASHRVDTAGRPILRSLYGSDAAHSSKGRVKLVSGLGFLYVFRVSAAGRLVVSRFVLDGMENELVPKLEVRFHRSAQRLVPEGGFGATGEVSLDTLAYRNTNQVPFFEPATELSFLGKFALERPWFSVELMPTAEHGKHRWTFFVAIGASDEFDGESGGSELELRAVSVAASGRTFS